MYSKEILLNTVERIKNFTNEAIKIEEDVDVKRGRYVIDAKSIMGIFTLDLTTPIEVVIHTDDKEKAKKFFDMVK